MWQVEHRPGSEVRLAWQGHEYFCLHLGVERGDRPHADPVRVPGGPSLTCFAPHDHLWHCGFWFNWKYIDGVNYWENAADGHPEGRIRPRPPEALHVEGDTARLRAQYAYIDPRRGEIATETRQIAWRRPADDGSHALDWTVALRAGAAPLTLDRTPVTQQTPWGGYGGLSWRFARGMGQVEGLDAAGRRGKAIEHQSAAWATLWGRLDGGPDLWAGVAMFDHPSNPRHPTPWRFIADPGFAYLNPSPLFAAPWELSAGEELVLHYRVLVYPGPADGQRLAAEFAAFAVTPVPSMVPGARWP
jgi:hypothetical protein